MSEEVKELLEDLKKCGNRYTENQYYMLYKHDIEKLIPYIEKLQQEKTQLEYLRSGEYLNQLKFERNMLENIVKYMEVSKEDKEFIDMTHRNTELLEENTQLKSVLKEIREYIYKSLINVGRNEDCFEYYLETTDIEKLLEIIDKGITE